MRADRRAASSIIGVLLLVAVVIVLVTVAGGYLVSISDNVSEPAPVIADSTGEFIPQDGNDGGIVRIEHRAGDTASVHDLEVAVVAECAGGDKQGRLVDLPVTSGNSIDDDQIEGDNIFDQRSLNTFGGGALLQDRYASSDTILFRIPDNKCDLAVGAEVVVRVVHLPSDSVVITEEFVA